MVAHAPQQHARQPTFGRAQGVQTVKGPRKPHTVAVAGWGAGQGLGWEQRQQNQAAVEPSESQTEGRATGVSSPEHALARSQGGTAQCVRLLIMGSAMWDGVAAAEARWQRRAGGSAARGGSAPRDNV